MDGETDRLSHDPADGRERGGPGEAAAAGGRQEPPHRGAHQSDPRRRCREARRGSPRLGSPNYADLYRRFGFRLDDLADQCRAVLESTEQLYEHNADKLFRDRAGVGLSEARRWDVARVFRAPAWDEAFPAEKMMPALEGSLGDLGIDLRSQKNVELDIEQRPMKSPRAFCAPIEVPGRVVLVDPADGRGRRLARALPRGRPHGALRARRPRPPGRGAATRRRLGHGGLGHAHGALPARTTLALAPARLPADPKISQPRRRRAPSTSSGATAPSSSTSSSSTRRPSSTKRRCRAGTWSFSATL